jgi:hypothetical protein
MKTFAYIVVSFAALAPMHAYAGQAQAPNAPFQLAEGTSCNNGISIGVIGKCNDVDVDIDIGQAQVPNASSQLAWGTSCDQGISVGDIGNCMNINLDLDVG